MNTYFSMALALFSLALHAPIAAQVHFKAYDVASDSRNLHSLSANTQSAKASMYTSMVPFQGHLIQMQERFTEMQINRAATLGLVIGLCVGFIISDLEAIRKKGNLEKILETAKEASQASIEALVSAHQAEKASRQAEAAAELSTVGSAQNAKAAARGAAQDAKAAADEAMDAAKMARLAAAQACMPLIGWSIPMHAPEKIAGPERAKAEAAKAEAAAQKAARARDKAIAALPSEIRMDSIEEAKRLLGSMLGTHDLYRISITH